MASWLEKNLFCPVCREIYKDPVLLPCSHSFCKACWQRWWKRKTTHECPVCRTQCSFYDPPKNLVLKNLCEDFLSQKDQGETATLCSLHNEELKLFCLDHQQPVCLVCLHSSLHISHNFRPINEAALDYKEILKELWKPTQEKLDLFKDVKGNFDQTAKDIEAQAEDTERQIKDVFLMLQKFLQKEEQVRLKVVREEKKQKSEMMKRKTEDLSRETAALSDRVSIIQEVLRAEDLPFLQKYKTAAAVAQLSLPEVPKPIPALMNMTKHLNNLPSAVLDRMKEIISASEALEPKTNPALLQQSPKNPSITTSKRRTERPSKESTTRCCLHSENLRFFCMDHQQPVCFICLHSETHTNHSIRPINEAARDYKEGLQELLRPLQEKRGLFTDIKASFDQTAQDIEVQTHDTEIQMREVFLMLQTFLQKEEEERIAALRGEGEQKSQMKRRNSRALSREILALSDTIRGAEEVLREKDLPFLQRYKTTAELLHSFQSNDPQLTSGARIDVNKHLDNLPFKILDSMKEKKRSLQKNPPLNLALENLCEDFSQKKTEKPSTALCSLHNEELKLFCLAHQQPVCLVCLHSETHTNHSIKPINEAARDYKEGLQELLRPLQEKRGLFTDIKASFDETAQDIEVQAEVTEMEMREVFSMLQTFLQKEEEVRIAAMREEEEQKSQMI
ncbi:hypothetical protein L3Q82_026216, partial [Scortum barcoo]